MLKLVVFFIFKVFKIVKILRSFFWGFFICFNIFKFYIYYMAILSGIHLLQYILIQCLWNIFLKTWIFQIKKLKSWSLKILLICIFENYVFFFKSCIFSKTVVRMLKFWNWSYLNNLIALKEKIFVVFME